MRNIVYLAAYRERRKRENAELEPRPPDHDGGDDHEIRVRYQMDGSYRARIAGIYAESSTTIAMEHLADVLKHLAQAYRAARLGAAPS